MDLCVADVTDLPEEAAKPGERARLLGPGADLDEFARASGTIGYTVLTNLGARYARRVVGG
jgi:alanine racemase